MDNSTLASPKLIAYIAAEGVLVRDMWVEASKACTSPAAPITENLKIPDTKPEFFAWARPTQNPDPVDSTRGWVMAISGLSNRKVRCELTVLVHGFVSQRQLAMEPTGNWNMKYVSHQSASYDFY